MNKDAAIATLTDEIEICQACDFAWNRKNVVVGSGNIHADVVIVGEAPGQNEDEQGQPFVGRSGNLLTKFINSVGWSRDNDIYICNILKCRPPDNRTPTWDEINTCLPFLEKQLKIIKPKAIMTLGSPSSRRLLNDKYFKITKQRGKWFKYRGIHLLPTYHPAYVLRQHTEEKIQEVKADFAKVAKFLEIKFLQ